MNTTKTESAEIREKRKRISRRYEIQGQIVAKSYVNWYHKRKKITEQIVIYDSLSYKIIQRKILLIEENAGLI